MLNYAPWIYKQFCEFYDKAKFDLSGNSNCVIMSASLYLKANRMTISIDGFAGSIMASFVGTRKLNLPLSTPPRVLQKRTWMVLNPKILSTFTTLIMLRLRSARV